MGTRIRGVAVVAVVLVVGAFLGSALEQLVSATDSRSPATGGPAGEGTDSTAVPAERIRVEVLNGAGRSGLARTVTDHLRDSGFDVVYFGNAEHFEHERSAVVDRVGRPELARAVAGALGIERVRSEPDSTRYLDVSVVLGQEWQEPPETPLERDRVPVRAWWDLRRLFDEDERPDEPQGSPGPPGRMADPGNEEGSN